MNRLLLIAGILTLGFALSACNTDRNQHHREMMNGRGMGGMMQDQTNQEGGAGNMGDRGGQTGGSSIEPVTRERARTLARHYLESTGNTNFILGEGQEGNSGYEFPLLVHADSSRVASLLVDKQTGEVSSQK